MPEKYTKNVAMLLIWEKWYAPGKSTKLFLENPFLFAKKIFSRIKLSSGNKRQAILSSNKKEYFSWRSLTFLQKGGK